MDKRKEYHGDRSRAKRYRVTSAGPHEFTAIVPRSQVQVENGRAPLDPGKHGDTRIFQKEATEQVIAGRPIKQFVRRIIKPTPATPEVLARRPIKQFIRRIKNNIPTPAVHEDVKSTSFQLNSRGEDSEAVYWNVEGVQKPTQGDESTTLPSKKNPPAPTKHADTKVRVASFNGMPTNNDALYSLYQSGSSVMAAHGRTDKGTNVIVKPGEDNAERPTPDRPRAASHFLADLPNAAKGTPSRLSREREERLISLHVQALENPNAVPYTTNTGARKYSELAGVLPSTSYTPHVEVLVANTGASKGAWSAGVDLGTSYAGDVMLFPTVACVHKGYYLDDLMVAECDEPTELIDGEIPTITDAELPDSSTIPTYQETPPSLETPVLETAATPVPPTLAKLVVSPALPLSSEPKRPLPPCKALCIGFGSLKTSEEPTFIREEREPTYPLKVAHAPTLKHSTPPPTIPLPLPSAMDIPQHPSQPLSLQAAIEENVIPNNLNELELLGEVLAKALKITPAPSFLDMRGGVSFDAQKDAMLYSYPRST